MGINQLLFKCPAFNDGDKIPKKYTGYGEDVSPEFVIENLSPEAETLIITLEDLSHPINNFTHWIVWNLPASHIIPEGIPNGKRVFSLGNAMQGIAYGFHKYAGPKPPKGKPHKYCFTIYALNTELSISNYSWKSKVLRKARNNIIQQGKIHIFYE